MNKTVLSIAVPEGWREEADEMDVSVAEYVRRMCRAGRLQWGYDHLEEPEKKGLKHTETDSSKELAEALQAAILRNLSTEDGLKEGELADVLFEEMIDELGVHLQDLKEDGMADYNPREGGWVKDSKQK
jgi:hypothetical protein